MNTRKISNILLIVISLFFHLNTLTMSLSQQLSSLSSSLYNLENRYKFFKAQAGNVLPAHLQYKAKYNQTDAWKSVPTLNQLRVNCFEGGAGHCPVGGLGPFKNVLKNNPEVIKMVEKAEAREKLYLDTHYVFYHAQKGGLRIIVDLNTVLCQLEGKCKPTDNFYVLRSFGTKTQPITKVGTKFINFFTLPPINTWIDESYQEAVKKGTWTYFDDYLDVSTLILSTNLSLFGNILAPGESTFQYFLTNNNANPIPFDKILDSLVGHYVKNNAKKQNYINRIIKLTKANPGGPTLFPFIEGPFGGTLYQIFIPRQLVSRLSYLSRPWGKFWSMPPALPAVLNKHYDHAKNRFTSFSPILKQYQNKPSSFMIPYTDMGIPGPSWVLDAMQGRILLYGEYFAAPDTNNIKIFRYSRIDFETAKLKKYFDELTKIAKEIYAG